MSTFRGGKPWEEKKGKKLQLFTAGEKASLVLCLAMLIFALQSEDVPLCFLIFAFFCYELQNVLAKIAGQRFCFLVSPEKPTFSKNVPVLPLKVDAF